LADGEPGALHGVVDGVDVLVGAGGDSDALPGGGEPEPFLGDPIDVLLESAGDDPVVGLVGIERARVAAAELEGRGGFPELGEAVDAGQLVHAADAAEFVEQAASADGLQLAGVTNQRHPPVVCVGQVDEVVE
jgi:hypothetical protein